VRDETNDEAGDTSGDASDEASDGSGERREVVLALFREHHDNLLRLARLLTGPDTDAHRLVRDAFVWFHSWWDGRSRDDMFDDLRFALLHAARSQPRRTAARRGARNWVDTVPGDDAHERVIEALRMLSARQRECVVLRHYSGFTESQIARAVGCSIGSVRTHYRRGMSRLTGLVDVQEPEPVA
jgi:DNA-directed RNA polymerase specialized sigma24 family protein